MVKKIAENFNRLSRVHQRHRRQTDGTAMAYSEREREFTFAKNLQYTIGVYLYRYLKALAFRGTTIIVIVTVICLHSFLLANVLRYVRYMLSAVRLLSVCCPSVCCL